MVVVAHFHQASTFFLALIIDQCIALELNMHLRHRVPFIPLLQLLLHFSGFIRIGSASEFGTSDIYTASIVAARNNIPVLLFRDAQCKFCPKVEDFLVGLGAKYQIVIIPSPCPPFLLGYLATNEMFLNSAVFGSLIDL